MKQSCLAVLFCFLASISFGQEDYFQQKVDYVINVRLNDLQKTLDGFEVIHYSNRSPDTLRFIWFHLWPNAYKNDRTAFSDQRLQLGRTDFYFSGEDRRGYINRLNFKVNGVRVRLVAAPQHMDVAKLILPWPLSPGQTIEITTPFHEKLPFNFSRGGYVDHSFQVTQWYPKPAVYDRTGWHPMPYLDQGEFYSEFGDYRVQITLPKDYVVAATGQLQTPGEREWLLDKCHQPAGASLQIAEPRNESIEPGGDSEATKTIVYQQRQVHDFAWFANRNFTVRHDTLQLPGGSIVDAWVFFLPSDSAIWRNALLFEKDAVRTRSRWLGEYPYRTVSVVEAKLAFPGGMEYPTITSISPMDDERSLDITIGHEINHNWLYGILATNERTHPWMDEGMNTYFDNRYTELKYGRDSAAPKDFVKMRFPANEENLDYRTQIAEKKDQPIETPSADFSATNYDVIAYYKTGLWMRKLQNLVGKNVFDSCLHAYYDRWKFKHPYPEDFRKVVEDIAGKKVDTIFSLLYLRGRLDPPPPRKCKIVSFFSFRNTDRYRYLFWAPAFGFNDYDRVMAGVIIHNYTLPEPAFHFFIAPLYATGSRTLNFAGGAGYALRSYGLIRKAELSLSAEKFSMDEFTDASGLKNYLGFIKIVPGIKLTFRNRDATSTVNSWLQWKTYLINETQLSFLRDTVNQQDVISYPKSFRYLNQLTLALENRRVLYPYSAALSIQQAARFARLSLQGIYFFNYPKGGGLNARLFAGKFIYLGARTIDRQFETDRYHLNLTGPNGYEDYTYSNYFIGRNEFQGAVSQQIMIADGGFKVRSDLLSSKIGKTDNWLSSLNLTSDLPAGIDPLSTFTGSRPLKFFVDIGTYAAAWDRNPSTGKFLYDAGLQLSVYKNLVNVYIPVIYSKVYGDYYKSTITKNRFWKTISFSIDVQHFRLDKFINLPDL